MEQYLRCMAFQQPKKWIEYLPAAEFWYNCSYHTAIKMSPFEALYEYAPPLLTELPATLSPAAQEALHDREKTILTLQHNLAKAQTSMKKYADKKGLLDHSNWVTWYISKMIPQRETTLGQGNPLKLASKWYGPFKIIQTVGKRAYKLQLPAGTLIHDVFHVSHLKKHIGPRAIPSANLPLVTPSGMIKFAPVAILQHRQVPRREGDYDVAVPQWLIKWEGMAEDDATWEDADFIMKTFPVFKP
jgi:hypothetical protein